MSTPQRANALFRRDFMVSLAGLCAGVIIAYHNSFGGSLVFDDLPAILDNPSLRAPWSLPAILQPAINGGATVSGRPVVNLSFALNQMTTGQAVWGYHATNLLIHLLAGLVLFGVVQRTLQVWLGRGEGKSSASRLLQANTQTVGFFIALIWLLHPLQTESVTYIVQRTESLMGFWYLLTLYGFIRSAEGPAVGRDRPIPPTDESRRDQRSRPTALSWQVFSFSACLLGMATKEVMVSAPLVVLLYNRTFIAGSLREAWRRRRSYYLGLASTWLLLAFLLAGNAGRGGTAGFGAGITAWDYALTQCRAMVHYLRLVIWPDPLVFDYGTGTVHRLGEVWPQALLLLGLGGATVWALWRRSVWGFLGASFFAIMAPSSSVVPVATQTMAEHRLYLSLVIPVVLLVLWLHRLAGRWSLPLCGLLALGCGWLTFQRNEDYRTPERLWTDTVAKYPANGRAHHELGRTLLALGRTEEALPRFRAAIQLQPGAAEPHFSLGVALAGLGRRREAIAEYEATLRLEPEHADARNNLGIVLLDEGRLAEAEDQFRAAIRAKPDYAGAHSNLANVLLQLGRPAEAIGPAQEAVRLEPANVTARYNLGNAFAGTRQWPAAAAEYEAALRLQPDFAEVHNNLGSVHLLLQHLPEAISQYEAALRLKPGFVDPRRNLARALVQAGRNAEAMKHYEQLVLLRPDDPEIRAALERLQGQVRR